MRNILLLVAVCGCAIQPEFECSLGVESDEIAMKGVLYSGESLTSQEEFLGFGRFASFWVQKDCEFAAYAQSTELEGWVRTHVGVGSNAELQSILSPLLSRATWSQFTPPGHVADSSSLQLELQSQWEFRCDDCSANELDRDFLDAVGDLRALGGPDQSAMVDVMARELSSPPATSFVWPFQDAQGPASWSGNMHSLTTADSEIARTLWEDYAQARAASWPSHADAVYAESGMSEFALYFRETHMP